MLHKHCIHIYFIGFYSYIFYRITWCNVIHARTTQFVDSRPSLIFSRFILRQSSRGSTGTNSLSIPRDYVPIPTQFHPDNLHSRRPIEAVFASRRLHALLYLCIKDISIVPQAEVSQRSYCPITAITGDGRNLLIARFYRTIFVACCFFTFSLFFVIF